jgi:hypothetical protein
MDVVILITLSIVLLLGLATLVSPQHISAYLFKLGVLLNYYDRESYTRGIEDLFKINLKDDPYAGFCQYYSAHPEAEILYRVIGLGFILVALFMIYKIIAML